jgi:hypothetical protein
LQFYDDEQVSSGVKLEVSTADLGPREALRLFFTINSNTLPEGDVYAAIFLTTDPKQPRNGVGQLVRVGTLLSIVNKTPGQRKAEITGIKLPFIEFTDTVKGSYSIKNIGEKGTGFYPTVKISSKPWGKDQKSDGTLLFGGHERTNDVSYQAGPGIHYIEVSYGDSRKGQWVIMMTPWLLILMALIVLVIGTELVLLRRRRKTKPTN